jgi:hypothetical protein
MEEAQAHLSPEAWRDANAIGRGLSGEEAVYLARQKLVNQERLP